MCGFICVGDNDINTDDFARSFACLQARGPDASAIRRMKNGIMGFHRLAIMGLEESGMQPMEYHDMFCVCNGEIYNYRSIKRELSDHVSFVSGSDCEVLLPLWEKYHSAMFSLLDGEFAMVFYDEAHDEWIAARDPLGIRPMFYGYIKHSGSIAFASEMKALLLLCDEIKPFPIGCYYQNGQFVSYHDCTHIDAPINERNLDILCSGIRERLEQAVIKRLNSDAPMGFLLSGGLDSSLVCAIAAKQLKQPIQTFAVGMKKDAIDLSYARVAAEFIGSEHHEILIDRDMVLATLPELIYRLESFDITTIRASLGMYLMCREIHQTTDIKVLMSGEISDELFGYKYTDFAPSAQAFQEESKKRLRELYMYDVLRADRCISANGIEARVPFSDKELVRYVLSIDPELKLNRYGIGKYLLRHAFADTDLPHAIRMREKAAFSDAVGHSMVDEIKAYAQTYYSDEEWKTACRKYRHVPPISKESLLYRELFERFFPGRAAVIKDFWMPNQTWPHCAVNDPSARVLSNYGASGEGYHR